MTDLPEGVQRIDLDDPRAAHDALADALGELHPPHPAFIWSSKAWYATAADCKHELTVGMFFDDGGCNGELSVRWHFLAGAWAARLEVFEDAWQLFATMPGLFAILADLAGWQPSEETLVERLRAAGFADRTPYTSPYPS